MGTIGVGVLATAGPADGSSQSIIGTLFPFAMIFVVFYLLVFAPMRRKQKRHAEMLQSLKAGDRVITNGGIHGTVVGVSDRVVQVRIADQIKIDVSTNAIAALQNADE